MKRGPRHLRQIASAPLACRLARLEIILQDHAPTELTLTVQFARLDPISRTQQVLHARLVQQHAAQDSILLENAPPRLRLCASTAQVRVLAAIIWLDPARQSQIIHARNARNASRASSRRLRAHLLLIVNALRAVSPAQVASTYQVNALALLNQPACDA